MLENARETLPELSQEQVRAQAQLRSDSMWKREIVDAQEVPPYYKRRSAGVWAGLAAIAVALVAASVYGYWLLEQQDIQVAQIPGIVRSLPELHQRMVSTANALNAARIDQQNLAAQLQSVDAGANAALENTRQQMTALVGQMQRHLLTGMNQTSTALQAQVSQLLSQQGSYQNRLAQLETQLIQARADLTNARREYAQELADLRSEQIAQSQQLVALNSALPTRQIVFQIQKNQPTNIAPGVSFKLTKTDVGHQRFDGFIVAAGEQKLLLQNQGLQNPVVFLPSDEGKPLLMVATRIDHQSVAGYLLVPANNAADGHEQVTSIGNQPAETATQVDSVGVGQQ